MENSILNRCDFFVTNRLQNDTLRSRVLIIYLFIQNENRKYLETQLRFILSDLSFYKMAIFNVQDTEDIKNQSVILIEGVLDYHSDLNTEDTFCSQAITLFERLKTIFSEEDYKKLAEDLLLPGRSSMINSLNESATTQLRKINKKWELKLENILMEVFNTEEKLYIESKRL